MVGESGGAVARSTAIVVFTDLVGSTELRSRLGEDAAEELRRNHDRLIESAVEANRGRLVKNLGDGVMATFTGASDALAAAVGIQQALDRHNRSGSSDVPLEVRIGISAGDVAVEEGDCFGTPVIEASRLCAAADGGKILVTEVVRLLAGTVGGHQFAPVGALDLKGLPAPVPAYEVTWESLAVPSVPMPALLSRAGRIFVGRDEELEQLSRLWKEASAGELRVALLAGEPGIGKTRLAVELAGAALESGGVVLAGRCDEDLGVPYQPFVEALRHYATHSTSLQLGRHGGELTRLVPELRERVGGLAEPLRSDPETERYRLFDAVASWLAAASAETPVLLVLDDLHWAAKPTVLLLRHVLRSAEPVRLLVVVTYRDTDIGRGDPLAEFLADLRREGAGERLPLTGLDRAGVGAFLEVAAGHSLPGDEGEEFIRAVWQETEGNPFFVAEVIRHLTESGALEQREGRWVTTAPVEQLGIPEGIRDVVGSRLSRLPQGSDRILGTAAVAGLEFEPVVIVTAGGFTEDELFSALEAAAAARLVAEVPGCSRYRFSHALVRATLYDEISGPRRAALHRHVAEAIETIHGHHLDDHLPALAHHWARASVPAAEANRAVDYATRAGDRALAQLAHDEAAAYYAQALELLGAAGAQADDRRRVELLISLGEAQRRAGQPAYRETLLRAADLARLHGDTDALARAALANNRGALYSDVAVTDTERTGVLEAALRAPGVDLLTQTRLRANLALELSWDPNPKRRRALSDEALASARELGEPATLAHVLLARDYSIAAPDNLDERLANTTELLRLAETLGDPVVRSRALHLRFRAAMDLADVEEAERCLAANEALVGELGQPGLAWPVMLQRSGLTLLRGDLAAGSDQIRAFYEHGVATGQPDAAIISWVQRQLVGFERGDLVEEEIARQLADRVPLIKVILGTIRYELGRPEEARRIFNELDDSGFAAPFDFLWVRFVADCAWLCAQLNEPGPASTLHARLEPFADRLVTVAWGSIVTGSVSYYLGLLASTMGRFNEAEARFAAAAQTHQRIGAPTWLARTRLEWARMLMTRRGPGEAERARELLGQALATARELGLPNIERRAVELLSSG